MATLHPPLDDTHDLSQILYSSLLMLGLDATSLEHDLRTPVNQKMFMPMNKKLGEFILHFLFVCIDRSKSAKVFRECWPIVDKKQESQFHKATFEWYKSLQQSYGQPIPAVVAKTFLSPGGPKFTSALVTLTTIALHSSVDKRALEVSLLHFPSLSRNSNQNYHKLHLLQASKRFYVQEFVGKQKAKENILLKLQERAKVLVERYRNLCGEKEKTKLQLKQMLQKDTRLSQTESFENAPMAEFEEEILGDIRKLNRDAGNLWNTVTKFQDVESMSWRVLSPLLEGTASLSHLDGSVYSPSVPEIVYKQHASEMSKMGLQGLYCDGKLNLLSLVQYSTLAFKSLLATVRSTHAVARPESSEELKVQAGRAASMSESLNELSSKVNILLPSLVDSVSSLRMGVSFTANSWNDLDIEGKPQLCPPTPPLSLVNTPVKALNQSKVVPLQLTPGVLLNKRKTIHCMSNATPSKLLSSITMSRAGKKSPKADVIYSSVTHKDDSIILDVSNGNSRLEEEAGLTMEMVTVDCRGSYQIKKEKKDRVLHADRIKAQAEKPGMRPGAPRHSKIPRHAFKSGKNSLALNKTVSGDKLHDKTNERTNCNSRTEAENKLSASLNEHGDSTLIDRIADMIASGEGSYNDSGALELMATLSFENTTVIEASVGDSGCGDEGSDSETFLETLEKINITPKEKQRRNRDSLDLRRNIANSALASPVSTSRASTPCKALCLSDANSQFTRLIDVTPCHQGSFNFAIPEKLSEQDPFRTPAPSKLDVFKTPVPSIQVLDPFKTPAPATETRSSDLTMPKELLEGKKNSNEDLYSRISALWESPNRGNPTSFASKVLTKFGGIALGKWKDSKWPTDDGGQDVGLEEPRHYSKNNLKNLMEQANLIKLENSSTIKKIEETRKTIEDSSTFLSFVENIRSENDIGSCKINVTAEEDTCEATTDECHSPKTTLESISSKSDSSSRLSTFSFAKHNFLGGLLRLEGLLKEDTLTEAQPTKNGQLSPKDEIFVKAQEFEEALQGAQDRRSSFLPRDSIFDTLTDSILAGETCLSLLNEDDIKEELRRESISSRRHSVMSLGRMSIGSTKGLSEALLTFQNRASSDCVGILDESDSCLLSTSTDDLSQW